MPFQIRILELLKLRFGESSLQASEVMLRDVRESMTTDRNVRESQSFHSGADTTDEPQIHAKILSRLFWPELRDEDFVIPTEISQLQERYENAFEHLKQSRKLTWLPALGQAKVELELEDRTEMFDVQTWQASVIHAFQNQGNSDGEHQTRTVAELMKRLGMDESLVRNGVHFWCGKSVLREVAKDEFKVLETKVDEVDSELAVAKMAMASAVDAEGTTSMSSIRTAEEVAVGKLQVYWQFIVGMLTNGGPMALLQISTMLKFAVAGGFPHSDEELRDFLNVMLQEDKLEFVAGQYRIKQ